MDHFCHLCFVFVVRSCLFVATLWSPAEKGLASLLSCVCDDLYRFCHFRMWCPGVVLDCIDS